jgi:hypothetical protein
MRLERETKGTYLYSCEEQDTNGGSGRKVTQYVSKKVFVGSAVPKTIEVEIKWDNAQ